MKKIWNKVKGKALIYLNSKSLVVKFAIMCVCCILIPIIASCIVLSYSLNKNLYEREMDNLNFIAGNTVLEVKSIFEDAVAIMLLITI